jgi:cytochrome c peroxidase
MKCRRRAPGVGPTAVGLLLTVAIVMAAAVPPHADAYVFDLPKGFPLPRVPPDNPMSAAKVVLGRHLFYDTRLSGSGTQSCATCHHQARAFTDGRARSVGATGEVHPRSSMSLVNVAYQAVLTWATPGLRRLEDQALVPMYGEHPLELGLSRSDPWLDVVRRDDVYRKLFLSAYPDAAERFTRDNVVLAIACFERSLISARSPYDRYHFDRDERAVSAAARRGERLFFSQPLSGFRCHGGPTFSGAFDFADRENAEVEFHNTGLYNLAGLLSYPRPNTGLFEVTSAAGDVGKFKAPTLRNVALTAPYMHDGSAATLDDVIDHYAAGGRTIAAGPHQGDGSRNPNKSPTIRGFAITRAERDDLIAFLGSLTDEALVRDPRFADPWAGQGLSQTR